MNLTKLAYLCVKSVYFNDDISFTQEKFNSGEAVLNPDYTMFVNNVYTCINEAVSRLSDLDKIPHRIGVITTPTYLVDLKSLPNKPKEILNVVYGNMTNYKNIEFSQVGVDNLLLTSYYPLNQSIFVEYKEDLPFFDDDMIEYESDETYGKIISKDVDLRDYNITNNMCNYIIEYVQGKLAEQSGESVANMHITRSEQYFNNIPNVKMIFPQQVVANKYSIEG